MKNPTILMNSNDFDSFTKELELKIFNFKVGRNLIYQGIPVKTSSMVENGNVVVYDDVFHNWL
jgi:hypothetical protein